MWTNANKVAATRKNLQFFLGKQILGSYYCAKPNTAIYIRRELLYCVLKVTK